MQLYRILWVLVAWMIPALFHSVIGQHDSAARTLSREECLQLGLQESLILQMQRLQLASASADVLRVSALYDPLVNAQGGLDDSELPPGSFPTSGGVERGFVLGRVSRMLPSGTRVGLDLDVQRNLFEGIATADDPTWRTAAGISLSQSLWNNAFGAVDRSQVEYVRQRLDVLALDYQQQREGVAAEILDTYWSAMISRVVAETQVSVVERLKQLLETNRRYVKDGLLDETAVYAVDASVAVAEVDQLTLRFEADALDERMKELIRLPSAAWDTTFITYEKPEQIDTDIQVSFIEVYEDALRYRADVEALRREEKRVEYLIRATELDNRADLEVNASIGRGDSDTEFSESLDFDKTLWSVGVVYGLSLGKSETRAALMQALLEREQVRVQRDMLELEIERLSRAAVRQVETSQRLIPATKRALDAQTKKLELELVRFNRGQSDTKTILDYENDRDYAERDYIRAIGSHQRALVALDKTRGTLLPEEEP
jgi:outer membrane protein TolC